MASRKSKRPGWWGSGDAPHLHWADVTIEIPCVWSTAAKRWESPDGRYYFDEQAATDAVQFFPVFLKHHIGAFAGQAFELLEWQKQLITRPLFGWKRTADGLRRFRKVFLFAPKGAGKSPIMSGTALYVTLFDKEQGAEVYALARDKDQAKTVHGDSQIMLELAPDLAEQCEVLRDSIYVPTTRSMFKVLSADAGGHHGWRPHGVFIDEIQTQKNRDQLEAASKSMAKRRQPILFMAGHAGTDEETIGFEQYSYAKRLVEGVIKDETLLPVLFEASPTDDWTSPDVWARVNPGYGVTVQAAGIAQEALEAQNEPRKLNDFLRFQLNRWTNQATAWLPIDWWTACEVQGLTPAAFAKYEVSAGLDMAQSIDYASFVVTVRIPIAAGQTAPMTEVIDANSERGQQPLDYSIAVFPFFWLPEERLVERERDDGLPLSLYKQKGLLFTSQGATLSADQVYRDITTKIAPQFPRLRSIGYDPAFAPDVAQRLSAQFEVTEIPQNFAQMTVPCHVLEGLLKSRQVQQAGHPILRWNVSNVAVKRDDAGRLRPVKPRVIGQQNKRIDGLVALLMSLRTTPAAPQHQPQIFFVGGNSRRW